MPPGCMAGRRRRQKPPAMLRPVDRVQEARFLMTASPRPCSPSAT